MKNIIAIILIVLSIGLFFLYTKPKYDTVLSLRDQKSTYENTLAKSKQLKTLRDSLLNKYNSISQEDKDKLQNMIPTKFDGVKLVFDINTMAAKYGMSIQDVKIEQANTTDNQSRSNVINQGTGTGSQYKVATISFSTAGQYQTFLKLLKDIEIDEELIDVKKLTIDQAASGSQGGQSSSNLGFKVVADTYYIN